MKQTKKSIQGIVKALSGVIIIVLAVLSGHIDADAQILGIRHQKQFTDSVAESFEAPWFGAYKDNYFALGTALGQVPDKHNSDVKFQISVAQRITRATLPGNSFLFLMYSQKVLWNVFEKSLPMRDINFNPGIGWAFPFFSKGRYMGKASLMIEHESNGRDGDASRSWNKISIGGSVMVNDWLTISAKYWIPLIDGVENRDILYYSGIYQHGVSVSTPNRKFVWNLNLVKRKGWNLNFNTIFEFDWLIYDKFNQYFFVQYYNGYGECLLDYNKFHSRLRVGFVIKPQFFSEF